MPILNPEVDARDETDGIIGYKKCRVSPEQGLAGVFQRIRNSPGNVDCNRPHFGIHIADERIDIRLHLETIVSCLLRTPVPFLKYQTLGLT